MNNQAAATGSAGLMAIFAAIAMIAAQVAARASRDALFLGYFDASDLPAMMMGAALLSIASAFALSRWLANSSPGRAIPVAYAISGVLMLGQWALLDIAPQIGAITLYLHVAAFGALLISGFWSVVNERFDPHTAKRIVPRIAAAAALGGVVGGIAAERISALFDLTSVMLAISGLHVVCGVCIWRIGRAPGQRRPTASPEAPSSGLGVLRETPFLRQMAGVVALCALLDALLDYALKAEAASQLDRSELIQFFAFFYTGVGVVTFLLQLSIGHRVLRKFGLAGAMGVFPVAVLTGGALAAAFTRLWTVAAVRAGATVAANSLFRAGFELLYTPIPAAAKRPAKIFVDVGAQRVGDLMGAGLIMLLLLLPLAHIPLIVTVAAVVAIALLWAVARLQRGYTEQLAGSLRSGVLELDDAEVIDATTARTLAASQLSIDRHALLAEIELQHQQRLAREALPHSASEPPEEGAAQGPAARATQLRVEALYSSDPDELLAVLTEQPGDPAVVPHVIRLLDAPTMTEPAMRFLRRVEASAVGAIVEALVDPLQPLAIQRRLARVLEASQDLRARDGIDRLLGHGELSDGGAADALFALRSECARSAARQIARSPALALSRERVVALVMRELGVDDEAWLRQGRRGEADSRHSALLGEPALRRIPRNVEHLFTLLGLHFDRRLMASTLAGLYSDDPQLRGTALEYLEVALPGDVHRAMSARLETLRDRSEASSGGPRQQEAIAAELLRSASAIEFDDRDLE